MHFNTLDDAIDATRRGDIWGVVHFPQNFTDEFVVRQTDGKESDNATIIGSQIGVNLDWSSKFFDFHLTFQFSRFEFLSILKKFNRSANRPDSSAPFARCF